MNEEKFECTLRNVEYVRIIRDGWKYANWKFKNTSKITIGSELWNELENIYLNYCSYIQYEDRIQELKEKIQHCKSIVESEVYTSSARKESLESLKKYEQELEMLLGNEDEEN